VKTELQRHADSVLFRGASVLVRAAAAVFFKNPEQGAQTTIHCSLEEKLASETGLYYR
jgi:hypothetical protein